MSKLLKHYCALAGRMMKMKPESARGGVHHRHLQSPLQSACMPLKHFPKPPPLRYLPFHAMYMKINRYGEGCFACNAYIAMAFLTAKIVVTANSRLASNSNSLQMMRFFLSTTFVIASTASVLYMIMSRSLVPIAHQAHAFGNPFQVI